MFDDPIIISLTRRSYPEIPESANDALEESSGLLDLRLPTS